MKLGLCFGGAFCNISVNERQDSGDVVRLVPPREPMLAREWLRQLGARRGWPASAITLLVDYTPEDMMTVYG